MSKPKFKTWYNGRTRQYVKAELKPSGRYIIIDTSNEPFSGMEPEPDRVPEPGADKFTLTPAGVKVSHEETPGPEPIPEPDSPEPETIPEPELDPKKADDESSPFIFWD